MLRVFKTPLSSSLVERSLGSIVSLVFVILVLQPLHNTSPVFVSATTVDAGTISDTGDFGGCGFLHNEARYYTVTSTITLQNVPAGDIFINDGLIRTLRRQLLLAECQIGLAEGVPCPSGTASLPCAQPVYVCKDSGVAENDTSTMVTQDVYEAVEDGRCEGGDVSLLVCDMVKQYGPELKELVDNGSCVAQCRPEGNQEGVAVSIDGCMSFDLTLSAPTEQAADVFVEGNVRCACPRIAHALGDFIRHDGMNSSRKSTGRLRTGLFKRRRKSARPRRSLLRPWPCWLSITMPILVNI